MIAVLGRQYGEKRWAIFESDQFKERSSDGHVIPAAATRSGLAISPTVETAAFAWIRACPRPIHTRLLRTRRGLGVRRGSHACFRWMEREYRVADAWRSDIVRSGRELEAN